MINKDKILEIINNSKNIEKVYESYIVSIPKKEGLCGVLTVTPAWEHKDGKTQFEKVLTDLNTKNQNGILTLEGFTINIDRSFFYSPGDYNYGGGLRNQSSFPFLLKIDSVPVSLAVFDIDLAKMLDLRIKQVKENKIKNLLEEYDLLVEENNAN